MREIKFRAYIPTLNKVCFKGKGLTLDEIRRLDEGYFRDDVVWVEYTGLKDKNGIEIYEGDIVRGWNDTLYTVAYQSSSGKYDCCDFKAWEKGYYDAYLDLCDIGQVGPGECHPLPCIPTPQFNNAEVIGNIYENPELLTTKTEEDQ